MDPAHCEEWLRLLEVIADRADAISRELFRSPSLTVREKPGHGPVTDADLRIEEMARELVAQSWPQLGVLGEEFGESGSAAAARLIIDPIDATKNFVRGIPIFATLLAVEADGEVAVGLVSAPALGARWDAVRGVGARRNGEPMRVSTVDRLEAALVMHSGLGGARLASHPGMQQLLERSARQRGYGDFYQHMLVAEGAGDVAVDVGLSAWDIAALQVVVEEAGGRATTLTGERDIRGGSLLSSNGRLHATALELLGRR